MVDLHDVRGVLFDLDGVFYEGEKPILGGSDALDQLHSKGIPYRFITNTTTRSRSSLVEKLRGMGLFVHPEQVITAPVATTSYLVSKGYQRCHLVVSPLVVADFSIVEPVNDNPDCVVVGDIGARWNYELLNRLFHYLLAGADLVAMHKNRFWKAGEGLEMDVGGFVAVLEYAAAVEAQVVGKPSADFYRTAIESLNLSARQVMVVGDDIESEVGAAQQVGMAGVLVKTGKYREDILARSGVKPDAVIDSIASLMTVFD